MRKVGPNQNACKVSVHQIEYEGSERDLWPQLTQPQTINKL